MSNSKICRDLEKLHPYCKKQAIAVLQDCAKAGLNVAIFETYRTVGRQKWLKANNKTKTLNSYHRLGLAVDFVFKTKKGNWTWRVSNKKWDQLADILEKNGFASLWKRSGWDGPHGEVRFKGVQTRTLYKELKECNGNLQQFWAKSVDPRLVSAGLVALPKITKAQTKAISEELEKATIKKGKEIALEVYYPSEEKLPEPEAFEETKKSWWLRLLNFFSRS